MGYKTTEIFVEELTEKDVVGKPQKVVYERYAEWCKARGCYCYKLVGLTKALAKRFNVFVFRRRINGKLTGFYEKK